MTAPGKLDFRPSGSKLLAQQITALIDEALVAKRRAEYEAGRGSGQGDVAKNRIGAGYIGTECSRALAYRYHRVPKEERESSVSPGELQRHAEAGFWTEKSMAEWFNLAGFDLRTERQDGTQFCFKAAHDPDTGQARLAGEIDGVFVAAPVDLEFPLPCLWESKKATDKKWKKFAKDGVAKADPQYHGQIQTNMAYLEVENTLFSMLNLDTMKPYFELIAFDRDVAQRLTDRAVQVFQSFHPEELPRITVDPNDFRCRFCDWADRCWVAAIPFEDKTPAPAWLAPKGGAA